MLAGCFFPSPGSQSLLSFALLTPYLEKMQADVGGGAGGGACPLVVTMESCSLHLPLSIPSPSDLGPRPPPLFQTRSCQSQDSPNLAHSHLSVLSSSSLQVLLSCLPYSIC